MARSFWPKLKDDAFLVLDTSQYILSARCSVGHQWSFECQMVLPSSSEGHHAVLGVMAAWVNNGIGQGNY